MSRVEELENEIEELENKRTELLKELELEKEFDYPFQKNEKYLLLNERGDIQRLVWDTEEYDQPRYDQGHVFKTKQEAEKERDKRILLTRFRQFRDKCNGDWKPKFSMDSKSAYIISFYEGKLEPECAPRVEQFYLFGYFKNRTDCERAIELFSDEIIRLWVKE